MMFENNSLISILIGNLKLNDLNEVLQGNF